MYNTNPVQRWSDNKPGTKERQWPSLFQRVEKTMSVIELLLETLKDLSDVELEKFKEFLRPTDSFEIQFSYKESETFEDYRCPSFVRPGFKDYRRLDDEDTRLILLLNSADVQDTVVLMVQTHGQRYVEKTKNLLSWMKRTDLVQRLSESNSGPKKKHSVNEHLSALIHKLATMKAVKELLLETLSALTWNEVKNFKWSLWFMFCPQIAWSELSSYELVAVMMKKCGQQSVEVTREVLMDMNRTDLAQRLSDSSAPKVKQPLGVYWPALNQKVKTMVSIIELLLETLKEFCDFDLMKFKDALLRQLHFHRPSLFTPHFLLMLSDFQELVFLMVYTLGQRSVEKTKEALKKMNKTDLVQQLSDSNSGPKSHETEKHSADEHRSALIQKVATIAAVKELLLETLNDLRNEELDEFKRFLQLIVNQKDLPDISTVLSYTADRAKIVHLMLQTFGQRSVELTREVFMDMKRTDLVQRLAMPSSGLKVKQSVDEHRPFKREAVIEADKKIVLETMKDLSYWELEKFKWLLEFTHFQRSLPQIPMKCLAWADRVDILVDLMVATCGQQSVEVTREVFMDMDRTDLVQRLSETISRVKEKQQPSLNQKVEAMTSLIELLLETLKDLSDEELEKFKEILSPTHSVGPHLDIQKRLLMMRDMQETVFLIVQTYGQLSLKMIKELSREMNRTDLVQRLSDISSGPKKKHSVNERQSALIHKVATMTVVKELLMETLGDLSYEELKNFKGSLQFMFFQRSLPDITLGRLQWANSADLLVDVMVEMCGQQSVEVTREVFMDMNRTDLVQKLSETSSGHQEKHTVDEHWPALIQKVKTMTSVIELLLETLKDLSDWELESFKHVLLSQTEFHRRFSQIPLFPILLKIKGVQDTVFLMVQTFGQQSVATIKEVFKRMNRADLVERLSHSSSVLKKKHSADELHSALIQRVATIAAVKQLLFETLNDLSDEELEKFKRFLQLIVYQKGLPDISLMLRHTADRAEIVDQMVQIYGQQSVELTREVGMNMRGLATLSSGHKEKHYVDEHQPALFEREAIMTSVKEQLVETLEELSYGELEKFKQLLQYTYFQKSFPQIPWTQHDRADRLVHLMVQTCGQQSVEATKEVLMEMNRTDLVQRLSEAISRLEEEHQSTLLQKEVTMILLQENLLEALEDLSHKEIEQFKCVLQHTDTKKGLPRIPRHRMETADRVGIVELMVENYGQQSVEVTREVLKRMNRSDLAQRLSDISSRSEGPSRSLEPEACGSTMQDSSDWTKLEPEVISTDADEAPTYSLQSKAGNFECSVSGLRWVCKEEVSFKYEFCSWEEPMERIESMKYMPAGPLMDVTVIAGELDEVYLPHWICIDDDPKISDGFAVLHISDCGDVVEKVSEVTPSHVKLSQPVFSPRAVLMKAGFLSVKINCKVLIYKTNTAFLTLHVYLIPRDPGLQQAMDKRELSYGYKIIQKPHPEQSLKIRDRFVLTADLDGAEIYPEKLKLRYESRDPNFFEVFSENPDRNFMLKLTKENEHQPVWTCAIRKYEYQSTGYIQGEHFVDKHQCDLIKRVSNIGPILDNLLREGVIQQEGYDTIRAVQTPQERMRTLLSGPLKAGGHAAKDIFYQILEKEESYLVADLKRKEL